MPKKEKKRKESTEKDRPEIGNDYGYHSEAYELFKSIRWDNAWRDFLELSKDGKYKWSSAWSFCKYLTDDDREKAKWLYAAIGPKDKSKKKDLIPHLGDWGYMRSTMLIGEIKKESLLFGNPKIAAVREIVKKHMDVMEVSQGIGEIMMQWLGRYDAWSHQVDAHFKYKLFDPNLSEKKNEERFSKYTKMQEYIFHKTIDSTREVLRCFGVGKDDIALLSQMMIAACRNRLGEVQANMMLAAATGTPIENIGSINPAALSVDKSDAAGPMSTLMNNTSLAKMLGTFLDKSQRYSMQHPDIVIDGVPEADNRTDPLLDDKGNGVVGKTNGKPNGKHKTQ